MDTAHIDTALAALSSSKRTWARLDIHDKISMLENLRTRAGAHATIWVEAAVKAKGLSMDSPLAGEEWLAGPYGFIDALNALETTLTRIAAGAAVLSGYKVSTRKGGQVVVEVSPISFSDRILFSGSSAQVWMQPQVTIESLPETIAEFYQRSEPDASVCLILGAGNVASIPPLDVVNKLFNEGQVALLKMNPVNEYLGEIFE
ncbi:MAG: aldehyde dehydrogenase, partial [Acidimicrobiia bacterium]